MHFWSGFSTVYRRVFFFKDIFCIFKYSGFGYGAKTEPMCKKIIALGPSNSFARCYIMRAHKTVSNRFGGRTVINNPACRDRSREWFKRIFNISSFFFLFRWDLQSFRVKYRLTRRPLRWRFLRVRTENKTQTHVPEDHPFSNDGPAVRGTTTNKRHLLNNKRRREGSRNDDQRQYVLRSAPFAFFISHRLCIPISRGHGRGP